MKTPKEAGSLRSQRRKGLEDALGGRAQSYSARVEGALRPWRKPRTNRGPFPAAGQ